MWMTPFYLFFGVLIIYIFQSQINLNKIKNFITIFLILFIFSPFAYAYISITETDKRTDFKGMELAKDAKIFFEKQNKNEEILKFVKGNEWIAGNISYHLRERPKWIYDAKGTYLCNKNLNCIKYNYKND
tara:strand:- start:625 stop:1014 length:390 start_codon:yes stop_codon:yes gene_type:complete